MARIRKILVPIDFSEPSRKALPHTRELANRFDSEIVILHVRTPYADDPNRPELRFLDEGKYQAWTEEQVDRLSKEIEEHHRVSTRIIRDISPASGILEYLDADSNEIDFVVMGTHGRSALGHFFLGSVAEKVVRHSPCPVLTVASNRKDYRDSPRYKKILVGFDFSDHSKHAVANARELVKKYDAHLIVLYVIEQEIAPAYYEIWRTEVNRELPEIKERARQALEQTLGEVGLDDIEFDVEVGGGDGRAHQEIVKFIKDHDVDLVVLGTHGLSGIERVLLGSTTEKVVRIAPCPVLTFHLERGLIEKN